MAEKIKLRSFIFLVIFLFLFSCNMLFAKEVSIPNRQGEQDTYANINTYDELYSVLEDLSSDYQQLLLEYNSLELDYEELSNELEEKKEELEDVKSEKAIQIQNKESDKKLVGSIVFILIALYFGIMIHEAKKNRNEK